MDLTMRLRTAGESPSGAAPRAARPLRILVVGDVQRPVALLNHVSWPLPPTIDVMSAERMEHDLAGDVAYDLIILDLSLPRPNALAVCRRLRAGGVTAPILVLSAHGTVDDVIAGLNAGADDYLIEPIVVEELRARLTALVRRGRGLVITDALRVGDLVLDRARHEVRRAGRGIVLTDAEYALLEYLMRHSDRAVTRSEIAAHMWTATAAVPMALVDGVIENLRKVLDQGSLQPLITPVGTDAYTIEGCRKVHSETHGLEPARDVMPTYSATAALCG